MQSASGRLALIPWMLFRTPCGKRLATKAKGGRAAWARCSSVFSFHGDCNHLKVFANEAAAETWLQENDPEGVAFEYPVEGI
jgi:hypothetical protein